MAAMEPLEINLTREQIEDHWEMRQIIKYVKKSHLAANATPDRDVHLIFPEGNFTSNLSQDDGEWPGYKQYNALAVYGGCNWPQLPCSLTANGTGWMRFIGQGPDKTIITVEGPGGAIGVRNAYRVSFEEMGFKLGNPKGTTTQGHITDIVAGQQGHVEVQLEDGFSTPTEIADPNITLSMRGTSQFRRYKYSDDGDACHVNETEEPVAYSHPTQVSADNDRLWRFGTYSVPPSYKVGDLVAFRPRVAGARAFVISASSNILFKNIRWYQNSLGNFYKHPGNPRPTENITFDGCSIVPEPNHFPKPACLASAQFGLILGEKQGLSAVKIKGIEIKNFVAQNTGGPAITIYHGEDVVLENISITDSWADGIYLYNTTIATEENIHLTRANLTTVLGTAATTPIPAGEADAMPTDTTPTTDSTPSPPTTDAATPTETPTSADNAPTSDGTTQPPPTNPHGQAGGSDGFNPLWLLLLLLLIPVFVGVFFFLRTRSAQSSGSSGSASYSPRRATHDDHQQYLMSENVNDDAEQKSHQADMTTLAESPASPTTPAQAEQQQISNMV